MQRSDILIVDDDIELREAYGCTLMQAGYDVRYAGSAQQCREALALKPPALMLLDVVLPDASGMDLCRAIKADPACAGTFVIHVSGHRSTAKDLIEGLEAGADGYLSKPLNPQTLIAHVKALLRIRNTEQALRDSEEQHRLLVADLKEANQKLQEYNRLKAEFVANVSHELRTPLTAIIGFAQLATMSPQSRDLPPIAQDAFTRILRNSRHLLSLIDDVLDLSKIEAGHMSLHCQHFEIGEVVQDAFAELQATAQQKELTYRLTVAELPLAFSDPRRIRQIVMNLLTNAMKFTPSGAIELRVAALDETCFEIVVTDTGIGIGDAERARIFDRFRQVDGSTTRAAGGVGLGLAIVRQLAELLGGTVSVDSELGRGSTFRVRLPFTAPEVRHPGETACTDPLPLPPVASIHASGAPHPDAPLVLVVEDDLDFAELLSQTVSQAGYRVRVAQDGITGLRLARELLPAVLLLDVMMPGMDGWRVLRELKTDARTTDIPIIVCSIVDNRPLGYHLGASDYLVKPVDPSQLTATLRDLSISSRAEHEGYVLVVDDEHGIRELLANALRQAGFTVRSAGSGGAALRIARTHAPRVILCDLMMPGGMSGFELIARVRAESHLAAVPIVVITGRDLTGADRRLIAGQIANVIRKGDLLMSDLESRLRQTLSELGVTPTHGAHTGC